MSRTNLVAVVLAVLVSCVALYDAFTHGLTGHYSAFSDDPVHGVSWIGHLGSLVHGLAYVAFVVVLLRNADAIDGGRRFRRVLRWGLIGAYGLIVPVGAAISLFGDRAATVGGIVATALFLPMLLLPPVLGVTLLVQGDRSPSAYLLTSALPAFGLVLLMLWLGSDWAHPGYVETVVDLGLALLGVRSLDRAPGPVTGEARLAEDVG